MKAVLRRHFEEVLNRGSIDVIEELYSDDYVLDAPFSSDGVPQEHAVTSGRDGLRERVELFRTAFPDIRFSVEEMFAEGHAVAARYVFRGTHRGSFGEIAATGRTVSVTGILVAHFRAGTIYEAFSAFDSGDMVRQLDGTLAANQGPAA